MIALFSIALILVIFWAGVAFASNTAGAVIGLGIASIAFGILIAAAQTRGFEGQYVQRRKAGAPYTWEPLFLDVVRLSIDRGTVAGKEPVYVQTPTGPQPITGIFSARINHEMSLVFDTATKDPEHAFNALKQGVM